MGSNLLVREDSFLREEDFLEKRIHNSGVECRRCGEHLLVEEEVVLVHIVMAQFTDENGTEFYPTLDDDGDFQFEPLLLHMSCWEGIYETLTERMNDQPAVPDKRPRFVACILCKSNIREWEKLALVQYGEMHFSERCPDGQTTAHFVEWSEGSHSKLCLSCLSAEGDESLWAEVSEQGECVECSLARCWRFGLCACSCHEQDDE